MHPGPAAGAADAPAWWPALTDYVAQMSAAWHAFAAWGRPRHPRLRVVFAMLAGGAPLHAERLAARGGPAEAIHDPLTSGSTPRPTAPRAIDAMLRMVGVDRLVHGSDRPVVAPSDPHALGDAVEHALTVANPERVLGATRCRRESAELESTSCRAWRAGRSCGRTSSSTTARQRCYAELLRDDDVAVWLICWMDDQDTGFHDHDVSAGAVAVVVGQRARGPARARRPRPSTRVVRGRRRVLLRAPPTSTASSTPAPSPR